MVIIPHWFLPTSGDARTIVARRHADRGEAGDAPRGPDLDYLAQVAHAAENQGFHGVLTPTGTFCEDAWLTTAALLQETRSLQYLVAFRPGLISPTLAAQQAATFQRLSRGRLMLNIVTGGDAVEMKRFGDWAEHDTRYARTDEFLSVLRASWGAEPIDFTGEHYRVEGATTLAPPDPTPPIYFGGSSDAALPVAAKHADVYLTWGEPPAQVAEKIERVRKLAAEHHREPRFGIRLHVIARDTSAEAWAVAQGMLDALDPAEIEKAQAVLQTSESVGQRRMSALHGGSVESLEISPNLWAGVGLVRGGAGTALVGSHTEIADRMEEYHALGIDEFIMSGYPHLEEAFRVGEGVLPELARRGVLAPRP
ncbi:LLM class flavin-dependent oxidoreductase [Actinomycetospora flava]|uniref:LLM class flavin-dependent oxidoreductase n=1 Tax=Actinomycetospora flava TaxID=3129232 RepID=A0ABU8M5D8_9PSEU